MSHLTASILNRPLAYNHDTSFEFPNPRAVHPLSPPDTEDDFMLGPKATAQHRPLGLGLDVDGPGPSQVAGHPTPHGAPNSRLKKMSYVAAAAHRENRERTQPKAKWLVVVIPPPAMVQDHGQLGHTLSHGPASRLSSGVLMPLFPTMYAQLTAIAREFNFPSTAGVCLYLHVVDNGMTFTPRVSDESWQLLWTHLLDHTSSSHTGLPIGGRLEFDIDRRQARWYEPWLASSQRLSAEIAPHESRHRHVDSKTDEDDDTGSIAPQAKTHVPRKLSLVDNFDTMSVRSLRGPRQRPSVIGAHAAARPAPEGLTQFALAPIEQADEPKSAKLALESRVQQWRKSASSKPTPLAAMGQTSLEPANMPNAVDVPEVVGLDVLNFEDFAWSVSSAGPPSDVTRSPAGGWFSPIPSVHMDRRVEGSVLLTPTTVSSLGPADYNLALSPISYMERLPSPDLAWRMFDDVPLTPTTLSSTGPEDYELSWSPLAADAFCVHSPDLAWRMMDDVPPTPTTVSSTGPEDYEISWSPLAADAFYIHSPDLAWRMMEDVPPTPTTASSMGPPSWPASPAPQFRPLSPDLAARVMWSAPATPVEASFAHWAAHPHDTRTLHVASPAIRTSTVQHTGYPHFRLYPAVVRQARVREARAPGYPFFEVYPAAYPTFDLYPALAGGRQTSRLAGVKLSASYPHFEIYATLYPDFEIYPGHQHLKNAKATTPRSASTVEYPWMDIYSPMPPAGPIRRPGVAAVYSFFDLYPASTPIKVVDAHPFGYPYFQLYNSIAPAFVKRPGAPTAYPFFDLYPIPVKATSVTVLLAPMAYPRFNLYPAPFVFGKTQPVVMGVRVNYPKFDLYPTSESPISVRSVSVQLVPFAYPAVFVYPAVQYQSNLMEIYGPTVNDELYYKARSTRLQKQGIPAYPKFDLYPAVKGKLGPVRHGTLGYPHFNLYPAIKGSVLKANVAAQVERSYPHFDLYPTVLKKSTLTEGLVSHGKRGYPHFDFHPAADVTERSTSTHRTASHGLGYPTLVIYPAVYPAIEVYPAVQYLEVVQRFDYGRYPALVIYPAVNAAKALSHKVYPTSHSKLGYPTMVIYPAVYPALEVYPSVQRSELVKRFNHGTYPALVIYAAVYPAMEIYPPVQQATVPRRSLSVKLPVRYPAFDLYSPVYPSFRIYDVVSKEEERRTVITTRLATKYPAIAIYEAMYPYLEIYPATVVTEQQRAQGSVPRFTHAQLVAQVQSETPATWGHVWPYAARQQASATWGHVWPYVTQPQAMSPETSQPEMPTTWNRVWPYATSSNAAPNWGHVWPYTQAKSQASQVWIPRKRHQQLHDEVFPEGMVATPVTMQEILHPNRAQPAPSPSAALPSTTAPLRRLPSTRLRSGTVSARPLSSLPVGPARPVPEVSPRSVSLRDQQPPAPALPALSPAYIASPARTSPIAASPSRPLPRPAGLPSSPARPMGLPSSPAVARRSTLARPMSVFTNGPLPSSSLPPIPPLSPLGEDEVVERSQFVKPSLPGGASLARAKTTNENTYGGARGHSRRASLVSERAKQYDSGSSTKQDIMSTLSQFPLPPPPQISTGAPVVNKLDRSKFAAFSGARP